MTRAQGFVIALVALLAASRADLIEPWMGVALTVLLGWELCDKPDKR